jgi:hypothetical protein
MVLIRSALPALLLLACARQEPLEQSKIALGPEAPQIRLKAHETKVPVLWPKEPLQGSVLIAEPAYFSIAAHADTRLPSGEISRATINISGTKETHNEGVSAQLSNFKVRGFAAWSTRNEEIATVTWIEDGTYYSVDVECSNNADTRCKDGTYASRIAESLVKVRP